MITPKEAVCGKQLFSEQKYRKVPEKQNIWVQRKKMRNGKAVVLLRDSLHSQKLVPGFLFST
jgi:hypothetical protein